MMKKKQRPRRSFTPEYKADVVKLIREGGRTISEVCRDLDLTETRVRAWVQQAQVDAGQGPAQALTSTEREELQRLRRENKQLQMEREILKKATAFFAKENR
jgi:transposase